MLTLSRRGFYLTFILFYFIFFFLIFIFFYFFLFFFQNPTVGIFSNGHISKYNRWNIF